MKERVNLGKIADPEQRKLQQLRLNQWIKTEKQRSIRKAESRSRQSTLVRPEPEAVLALSADEVNRGLREQGITPEKIHELSNRIKQIFSPGK